RRFNRDGIGPAHLRAGGGRSSHATDSIAGRGWPGERDDWRASYSFSPTVTVNSRGWTPACSFVIVTSVDPGASASTPGLNVALPSSFPSTNFAMAESATSPL